VRVHVLAVGRLRTGPERALVDDYLSRFEKTGRGLGLTLGGVVEVEDRKSGGQEGEAQLLRKAVARGRRIVGAR
jgi:23S rRNA (pseudouridine1915-N3)-methyltransferase